MGGGGVLKRLGGFFSSDFFKDTATAAAIAGGVTVASQALQPDASSPDVPLESPASIDTEGQAAAERLRRRRASAAARAQGRPGTILGGTNRGAANVVARQLTG